MRTVRPQGLSTMVRRRVTLLVRITLLTTMRTFMVISMGTRPSSLVIIVIKIRTETQMVAVLEEALVVTLVALVPAGELMVALAAATVLVGELVIALVVAMLQTGRLMAAAAVAILVQEVTNFRTVIVSQILVSLPMNKVKLPG